MAQETGKGADRAGERGPAEHRTRIQLLEAADAHFRRFGYNKTTVADLARAIGVSPAYVYRFFESKQSIGEAVCGMTLGGIVARAQAVVDEPRSATERLRRLYRELVEQSLELYFHERKLHDIVLAAIEGRWSTVETYKAEVHALVERLVVEGRGGGEFERKTPLDEASTAITLTLAPFIHPSLLEQSDHADLRANADLMASLVLRSLAP